MKKSKKKTRLFPHRAENWFKKYQTMATVLVPSVLSIIALIISIKANKMAKSQIEAQQTPNWDYKILNDQDNNLSQIQFVSLKNEYKIESLEIITPYTKAYNETIMTPKDTWNLYAFENELLDSFNAIYEFVATTKDDIIPLVEQTENDIPIIVTVKYVYNSKKYESRNLYKVIFNVYDGKIAVIRSLNLVKSVTNYDFDRIQKNLRYLNKTEYFESEAFSASDQIIHEIESKDKVVSKFARLTVSLGDTLSLTNEDTENEKEYVEVLQPKILCKVNDRLRYFQYRDSLLQNIQSKYSESFLQSKRIDSFLTKNPICDSVKYSNLMNCTWAEKFTFRRWSDLLTDIRLRIWRQMYPLENSL